jgi:hypothetical protein
MILSTERAIVRGSHRTAGALAVAVALTLSGFGLAGCGVVTAVNKVTHAMAANKAIIDQFTSGLKSSKATTFEATYVTTGSTPTKIVYAVRPPKDLAFTDTTSGGGSASINTVDLIVNSTGAYSCFPRSSGSVSGPGWTCQKLGAASADTRNKVLGLYTPSHWITFLRDFSLAAGFAGDKVTTSDMTLNGFSMHCVDFRAPGVAGTSKICTTKPGILGYVKVASNATSFQLKSYSVSPPDSLFKLPPGARVTKLKKGTQASG